MLSGLLLVLQQEGRTQQKVRVNPVIDRLLRNQPALMGDVWQMVDMEHGLLSLERLQAAIAGFTRTPDGLLEKAPIVRVPLQGVHEIEANGWMVQQVIERGAMGVIFPGVANKEEAAAAVRSMRRSADEGPPRVWGVKDRSKVHGIPDVWPINPDGELLAVIMIESREGIKNANEIMRVPGVGAINVGPNDLARSLGAAPATPKGYAPETEAAVQTVLKACKAHKVPCFLGGYNIDVKQRLAEGWQMLFVQDAKVISF